MRHPLRPRRGFTLIEIVAVLVIVSVLSGIAVQSYGAVRTKADAARIATQLHYVEDAIIEAILSGATLQDFQPSISSSNFEGSVLGEFLTSANFTDLPPGIELQVLARDAAARGREGFDVNVVVFGFEADDPLEQELHSMFPRTLRNVTRTEWLTVNSSMLAPIDQPPPPAP